MEFGKIEKINIKDIHIKNSKNSPLRVKAESLMPGEAVTVTGVERASIEGTLAALRKDGRKFTTHRIGQLKYQIIRLK